MTLHTSDEIQTIHRRGILLAFAGCVVLSAAVLCVALWMMHKGIGKSEKLPVSGDELFDPQKIHKIHLIFTKENWDAMEPERQGGGFGGPGGGPPGGGPGGNRGGGPGGDPGGGGFGDFNPDDFGVEELKPKSMYNFQF